MKERMMKHTIIEMMRTVVLDILTCIISIFNSLVKNISSNGFDCLHNQITITYCIIAYIKKINKSEIKVVSSLEVFFSISPNTDPKLY